MKALLILLLAPLGILTCGVAVASPPDRQVAITIDDLPASGFLPAASVTEMTTKLLATLREQKVPAVGFVNEIGLYRPGEVDRRIAALEMWLDAGFELGNHTFGHSSLNQAGLKEWEDDVIQGEPVIRLLLTQHQMKLRYFRHPYLDAGRDLETRWQAEAFLSARGYQIAPVTVDAWDWMYAGVYEDAKQRGDKSLQQQLVQSYLEYTDTMFAYDEQLSRQTLGYEPKQILLLHANELEADHLSEVIAIIRKRGYRFITLEDALSDHAYSLSDTYVGEGTSWLDHWAITKGKPPQGAPVFPAWVIERSKALTNSK